MTAPSTVGSETCETGVLAQDHGGLEDIVDERLELERLAMQIEASFVGASEREQTVHEIRHARRFLQRLLERDELLGGRRRRSASRARRRRAARRAASSARGSRRP